MLLLANTGVAEGWDHDGNVIQFLGPDVHIKHYQTFTIIISIDFR